MGSPVGAPRSVQDYGQTLLTTCRRRCGSNGFVIQPVAPAARPCCLSESVLRVVRNRIGVPLNSGLARKACDQLQSVHVGHVEIGNDDVDLVVLQHLQGIDPVIGLDDMEAGVAQGHGDHLAHGPGIIDSPKLACSYYFSFDGMAKFRPHGAHRSLPTNYGFRRLSGGFWFCPLLLKFGSMTVGRELRRAKRGTDRRRQQYPKQIADCLPAASVYGGLSHLWAGTASTYVVAGCRLPPAWP